MRIIEQSYGAFYCVGDRGGITLGGGVDFCAEEVPDEEISEEGADLAGERGYCLPPGNRCRRTAVIHPFH